MENAKLLLANTSMDTDKIKIFGSRVRVDSMQKVRLQINLTSAGYPVVQTNRTADPPCQAYAPALVMMLTLPPLYVFLCLAVL